MIKNTAIVLKALGEPTRLRIVRLLKERELCICELVLILEMSQPRVSQHVKTLKQAGIVRERRDGQRCFFSLVEPINEGRIAGLERLMTCGTDDLSELTVDNSRMQNSRKQPGDFLPNGS